MTDGRRGTADRTGEPVPRDLPDQQADAGEDPWEVPVGGRDTDEAGTGRQGASQSGTVHPEHPAPEESPG